MHKLDIAVINFDSVPNFFPMYNVYFWQNKCLYIGIRQKIAKGQFEKCY